MPLLMQAGAMSVLEDWLPSVLRVPCQAVFLLLLRGKKRMRFCQEHTSTGPPDPNTYWGFQAEDTWAGTHREHHSLCIPHSHPQDSITDGPPPPSDSCAHTRHAQSRGPCQAPVQQRTARADRLHSPTDGGPRGCTRRPRPPDGCSCACPGRHVCTPAGFSHCLCSARRPARWAVHGPHRTRRA